MLDPDAGRKYAEPTIPFLSFSPQHLRILRSFSKILGSCGKRKEGKGMRKER